MSRSGLAASVVLTTYNNPRALELVLTGLSQQVAPDFEVWVADDGSRDDTRRMVEAFASKASFQVHHVWHENLGALLRSMPIVGNRVSGVSPVLRKRPGTVNEAQPVRCCGEQGIATRGVLVGHDNSRQVQNRRAYTQDAQRLMHALSLEEHGVSSADVQVRVVVKRPASRHPNPCT